MAAISQMQWKAEEVVGGKRSGWILWGYRMECFKERTSLTEIADDFLTYESFLNVKTYSNILINLSATNCSIMLEIFETWTVDFLMYPLWSVHVFDVSAVTKVIEE